MSIKIFIKIFSIAVFILFFTKIDLYPQTVVNPVLTLNAPGIVDQDDMCIWIHPTDHSLSTIIASDKGSNKIFVYDLSGNVLQTINVPGMPGNIDLRYNFLLSGVPTDIVGYNDRTNGTIVFYKVDPTNRQLTFVSNFNDGGMTGDNYGFCLYHSSVSGKYYAIASSNSTQMKQWELTDNGDGTIGSVFKRTWNNGSGDITEGLVADDELGVLFAANEGEGIYKYNAEPDDPNPAGQLIAPTGVNGLTADVEGLTIFFTSPVDGFLIASSQGSNDFKVYERQSPHNFIKTIQVTGVGSTDGIDVSGISFGTFFPYGIFLVHDGTGSPFVIRGCRLEDLELTAIPTFQISVTVQNGWNMVSIPGLHPVNQNVLTWWPGKDPATNVFRYESGYQTVNDASPGVGYWMKHVGLNTYNTGDEWPAGGIQIVTHNPINGLTGWNLIGCYENVIPASDITTSPPGLISAPIYEYYFGYHVADSLKPGFAYWVKLSGSGQIIFP